MCFRLAVRELEAWLLADAEGMASFFSVEQRWIPGQPDLEPDPTVSLLGVVRRSKDGRMRRAMLPPTGAHVMVGPLYEATIIEFGEKKWDLARACTRSPSLARARAALRRLAAQWNKHLGGGAV
jgi:hypothetical protein